MLQSIACPLPKENGIPLQPIEVYELLIFGWCPLGTRYLTQYLVEVWHFRANKQMEAIDGPPVCGQPLFWPVGVLPEEAEKIVLELEDVPILRL